MPLTFPSHAAAVLPFMLRRRRVWWCDRVALVLGSTAPDLPYALAPYVDIEAHSWWGLVWFCVPVTMALAALTRWAAPTVCAHLPPLGPLALRDYAVLGNVRPRWYVTAGCAWVGALSHRLWDIVTHRSFDDGRIVIETLWHTVDGRPLYSWLFFGSTAAGALAVLAAMLYAGRNDLIRAGAEVPPVARDPRRFWTAVGAAWALGVLVQPLLAGSEVHTIVIVRLLIVAHAGLLVGAATHPVPSRLGGS
ncbi:hypothetical protein Val02_16900 [Virgisporangium aliadipatigenens]|uniref:DUF4184 family protein n=1 Tax=Virgisporangium aliadipatigenens TaxID=741659 RepID=A0A8J3YGG7_9ACTN|nr:DUF4184 family protein [Virgisporangium aliadipatigenens]GIJ44804.1 hypothetical protein Val02_16900 [Virgisporangium aliadipatigenens]